jgi:hypothetical protein
LTRTSPCEDWSLTSLKEKLIRIGAKVVSHGRYVAFQMAEVAIPKILFDDILRLVAELRPLPVTSTGEPFNLSCVRCKTLERCASMTENSAVFDARHGAGSSHPHRQPAPTAQVCLKRGKGANCHSPKIETRS